MKIRIFLSALLLSSCGPLGMYYKAGTPVALADRALMNCRVMAENQVPVREATQVIPGPYLPPRQICDASGACTKVPGRYLPPRIVTEDLNAGLRRDVVAQCMGDQGYEYVRVPLCSPSVSRAVSPRQTKVYPRLQANSCVVRRGDVWQIVTPQ